MQKLQETLFPCHTGGNVKGRVLLLAVFSTQDRCYDAKLILF